MTCLIRYFEDTDTLSVQETVGFFALLDFILHTPQVKEKEKKSHGDEISLLQIDSAYNNVLCIERPLRSKIVNPKQYQANKIVLD